MVIQNVSADGKNTDLTFTVKRTETEKTLNIIKNNKNIIFHELTNKNNVSKLSIVGQVIQHRSNL